MFIVQLLVLASLLMKGETSKHGKRRGVIQQLSGNQGVRGSILWVDWGVDWLIKPSAVCLLVQTHRKSSTAAPSLKEG